MKRKILTIGPVLPLLFLFVLPSYSQIKITPVASVSALGGKYYLDSDAASFNGRIDAFASTALKLGENHDFIPVYSGNFSGTQDIQELAGGGVLTRQRQTHSFSARYIYTHEFDKYKPRLSYTKALIKETKDEKWGDGLFDYGTLSFGIEAEFERPDGTFIQSYDYYSVKYPNYSTLLSDARTVIDTTTFNELSANAGENTLDSTSHRIGAGYTWFPGDLVMQIGADMTYRRYGEQALIARPAAGQPYFTAEKRVDYAKNLNYKVSRTLKPLLLSGAARLSWLSSTQNSYDSTRTKYIPDYYSYLEVGLAPAVSFVLKDGTQFSYTLDWRHTAYLGRLKQDAAGNYGSSKINQTVWLSSLSGRYPLYKKFFVRGIYNYQVSTSNMRYEANYRYNYRASTYLLGIEWEF